MRYLFVDNFRGFSNTRIPITDVNFFVGQNSTGKTSILGLLKLISSPQFFLKSGFSDEHVSFGGFSDIVSAHSQDKSYFRIGLVSPGSKGKKTTTPANGWLLTCVENNGLPSFAKYTFGRGEQAVTIRFSGNGISFTKHRYPAPLTAEEMVNSRLPEWIEEHVSSKAQYQKVVVPPGMSGEIPFLIALSLVWSGLDRPPMPEANSGNEGTSSESDDSSTSDSGESKGLFFTMPVGGPPFLPELAWVAPIRTKPRRTYDQIPLDFSPEGEHTPYVIRRMLRTKTDAVKFRNFVARVGRASGLFQDVRIKNFGRTMEAPFEVDIVLDGKALNLMNVGYGVSQSLPVIVEILARPHNTWFAIQQPEVHLHPRAQAALGDVIFEMAARDHKKFFIETHSDFTIDRFRMNYQNKGSQKPDSQILFFERRDKHNVVTALGIGPRGELPADQPESYREFFIREELRLLGI